MHDLQSAVSAAANKTSRTRNGDQPAWGFLRPDGHADVKKLQGDSRSYVVDVG